jgi:hypothetical protein
MPPLKAHWQKSELPLLEIADKGFDALSQKIDSYVKSVRTRTNAKDFNIELNSVSLQQFVKSWSEDTDFQLAPSSHKDKLAILIEELNDYGLKSVDEMRQIIPKDFSKVSKELGYSSTIFGLVRDWMILHDYERYRNKAWKNRWSSFHESDDEISSVRNLYQRLVGTKVAKQIFQTFGGDTSGDFCQETEEEE